jgi:hypothetical protein
MLECLWINVRILQCEWKAESDTPSPVQDVDAPEQPHCPRTHLIIRQISPRTLFPVQTQFEHRPRRCTYPTPRQELLVSMEVINTL